MNTHRKEALTFQIRTVILFSTAVFTGCAQFGTQMSQREILHRTAPESIATASSDDEIIRANDDGSCGTEYGCADGVQVEYGEPNVVVDSIGWLFGIPSKVLLWDRRAENHRISSNTVAAAQSYLNTNGMTDVKVRANQYAPIDEWKRLAKNKKVNPLWRLTAGTVTTVGYTIFPGRLFGHDNYNPFTNTVSLYSDIPVVAVHEAAYALDNHQHVYHGTYGFGQYIPGINIWHESEATRMAHRWTRRSPSPELVAEGDRILPPLCGMRVGNSVGQFVQPADGLTTILGAVTGHAVAWNRKGRSSGQTMAQSTGQLAADDPSLAFR